MQKHWYPQQNTFDAPVALLKNFIFHADLRISRSTIEKDTKAHKEFPYLTFQGLKEILEKWGINSVAYNIEMEKLNEIPSPSILFVHDRIGNIKTGEFIMFYKLDGTSIEYLHSRKGWVIEEIDSFNAKWAKAALSLTEIIMPGGENDFNEKEKAYADRKNANPDLKNVRVKDNFLTDKECSYIIDLSKSEFKRSKLMGDTDTEGYGRTSNSAELHVFAQDEILNGIRKRASELINIPETHFEFFQCVSYDPTQEYANHFDTFDETSERGREAIREGGQRKYTLLAYLNDDFEGGGTHFPNLDLLILPKKGRVAIFNNLDENEKVIKAAFHAGLPVTTGRKYAINIWVRTKPLR